MKNCFAIALTIAAVFAAANTATASPVSGSYNSATGEIIVDAQNVNNWYVESTADAVMTGDEPLNLPSAAGLVTNNDTRIGESTFALFTFQNTLGNVAMTGLADNGALQIFWNDGLGSPLQMSPLSFGTPPDGPTADITSNPANGFDALLDPSLTLDASGSTGTGLTYDWDLDNNGTFEVSTAGVSTLFIADVTTTFGPAYSPSFPTVANYPVAVRVTDSNMATDTAGTSINYIPEPTSMALAGLGMIGFFSTRRRRNG